MTATAAPRPVRAEPERGVPWTELVRLREAGWRADVIPVAAAGAAAALALSSTGAMVVAAALLGVACRSRWSAFAAVLATASVAVRFSTGVFDDVAGIQSVLGPAGNVGPPVAAASAWAAGAAVLLAVRSGPAAAGALRHLPAVAGGALAGAIVAGPGPGGALALRIGATAVAIALGVALTMGDERRWSPTARAMVAGVAGALAVVLAAWPG